MLEATVVESGFEFYNASVRAPPCEVYGYCTTRRELLRRRLAAELANFRPRARWQTTPTRS
eukprot:3722374-Pyramimonas_sp.AAC.1